MLNNFREDDDAKRINMHKWSRSLVRSNKPMHGKKAEEAKRNLPRRSANQIASNEKRRLNLLQDNLSKSSRTFGN
jgi:hypothetical protein